MYKNLHKYIKAINNINNNSINHIDNINDISNIKLNLFQRIFYNKDEYIDNLLLDYILKNNNMDFNIYYKWEDRELKLLEYIVVNNRKYWNKKNIYRNNLNKLEQIIEQNYENIDFINFNYNFIFICIESKFIYLSNELIKKIILFNSNNDKIINLYFYITTNVDLYEFIITTYKDRIFKNENFYNHFNKLICDVYNKYDIDSYIITKINIIYKNFKDLIDLNNVDMHKFYSISSDMYKYILNRSDISKLNFNKDKLKILIIMLFRNDYTTFKKIILTNKNIDLCYNCLNTNLLNEISDKINKINLSNNEFIEIIKNNNYYINYDLCTYLFINLYEQKLYDLLNLLIENFINDDNFTVNIHKNFINLLIDDDKFEILELLNKKLDKQKIKYLSSDNKKINI